MTLFLRTEKGQLPWNCPHPGKPIGLRPRQQRQRRSPANR
jgi:hypothetical protein